MDHEVVIRYISALGFPILASMALSWALYKIGFKLADAFVQYLRTMIVESEKQTVVLTDIRTALPTLCQANCTVASDCEHYKPTATAKLRGKPA